MVHDPVLSAPDPDAAQTMTQMMTCIRTLVEEFTQVVYRMAMAVRRIIPRPPWVNSVPTELLQRTPRALIGMEAAKPEPLSLDRVLLIYARRLI